MVIEDCEEFCLEATTLKITCHLCNDSIQGTREQAQRFQANHIERHGL